MSDKEFPEEAEKTTYERDKTAREPAKPADAPTPPVKPRIKPKKVFVAKKAALKTDKPMEHRVRHIRLSSLDAAEVIRQTILEFQKDLADQASDDPDKEFHDREKVEKFFAKLAKKYSNCATKGLGGELGWIYPGMKVTDALLTQELIDVIMATEKYTLPDPIRTKLGIHLILVCESQYFVPRENEPEQEIPKSIPGVPN